MIKSKIYEIIDLFTFKQNQYLKEFNRLDKLTIEQLKEFQLDKLRENLSIDSWQDFYELPITTKKDLPNKPLIEGEHHQHETSGSTGEPRVIWVPKSTWYRKDAVFTRSWNRMGRKSNDWVFRLMAGDPKYAWYDWWRNVFPSNYRNISDKTIEDFIRIKPKFIHGPGGSIRQLCELMIERGYQDYLKDVNIEWCSESANGHKERLEPFVKSFHQQYGLAELPTVGSPDGEGNVRVVMEQGIVEILDDNGNPVLNGEEGFIVVTDFNNPITPIIRYKCGDRGKMKLHTNRDGLTYYILYDIIGRGVDYYNGPEVKKPIGWSIVSPISHILGHVIKKWRVEVDPKNKLVTLYVEFIDPKNQNFDMLTEYSKWIEETYGLETTYKHLESEKYDIYFKNKLVKVV
jgi:phenylacetate-coenzyme A ligase PaaK-like adenylate-forming protein